MQTNTFSSAIFTPQSASGILLTPQVNNTNQNQASMSFKLNDQTNLTLSAKVNCEQKLRKKSDRTKNLKDKLRTLNK